MALYLFIFFVLFSHQSWPVLSHFDGKPGYSDVFRNPKCGGGISSSISCNCAVYSAECVHSDCRKCKCRKSTRIYRSDVRKCLSDIEARDPWCRYQFFDTKRDIIPTIDLAVSCDQNKPCSQPINAPFDKTKSKCRISWVDYLQNGTKWYEKPVRKFQELFTLRQSDYFAEKGYMYSLEWRTSHASYIPRRLFQVALECVDSDSMGESFCLMFRTKGKGEPKLVVASETRLKSTKTDKLTTTAVHPTRYTRRRVNTPAAKVVVVSDNFAVILAAIAGALGTALVVIPLALFCRRTTRTSTDRCASKHCPQHQNFEEVDVDGATSEETLSSYTSLKRNREDDVPPSIYQSLNKTDETDLPAEEPIYISVSGDEDDFRPIQPPPVYHVLEELESELAARNDGV